MEVSAQIEIAILSGWKPGEIDRVVGRNETWYASLDRSVEQNRLRFQDHIPQSRQRGYHAGRTGTCQCQLGRAAEVAPQLLCICAAQAFRSFYHPCYIDQFLRRTAQLNPPSLFPILRCRGYHHNPAILGFVMLRMLLTHLQ